MSKKFYFLSFKIMVSGLDSFDGILRIHWISYIYILFLLEVLCCINVIYIARFFSKSFNWNEFNNFPIISVDSKISKL
jgi:hypothetical protein